MEQCLVGISGGIDSLFAAVELKKTGYDVLCVNMHLHSKKKLPKYASEVLKKANIDFYYADYTKEFKTHVIDYFIDEYSKGYTPNPCVICNQHIKMKMLYKEAQKNNISLIATGHYADFKDGFLTKHKSLKDQSYFLSCVDSEILKHTLFPLNRYSKEEIKKTFDANIKESSDLCFIKNDYRELIKSKIKPKKGVMVKNGKVVGYHNGFFNYTIGQRKGVKVGSTPHYVTATNPLKNIVYVSEEKELYSDSFYLENITIHGGANMIDTDSVECCVRYNAKPKKCRVKTDKLFVQLEEKERAITPGQIAVFYSKNRVIACGKVAKNGVYRLDY